MNRNDACTTGYAMKLSATGALLWCTFFGSPCGNGQFGVAALALDSANNLYLAGQAGGAGDVPTVNGVLGYTSGVSYVAKPGAAAFQKAWW